MTNQSKWLLLLLIPMLFGFDTAGPFRTRGPFKAADFTIGGGSSTWTGTFGPCTSGVDCFCDRVQGDGPLGTSDPIYNSGVLFCDDYDNDNYYSLTPTDSTSPYGGGNVIATPSGQSWNRGGDSYLKLRYGAVGNGVYWTEGQPSNPTYGSPCTSAPTGCGGFKVWHADNLWNANAYNPIFDFIRDGEYGVENGSVNPSIPGSGGATVFGDASLGHRNGPGSSTGGLHGAVDFSATDEVGVTIATAFESNIVASNILTSAWKFDESYPVDAPAGYASTSYIGFRQTNGDVDYFPMVITLQSWYKGGIPNCAARGSAAQAATTKGEVYVDCGAGDLGFFIPRASHSDYRFSTDWDLTKWHCIQTYADFRTIGSTHLQMWLDGTKLIDTIVNMTNTDNDSPSGTDGIRGFEMNNYANEGAYQTHGGIFESTRRYSDNYVIRRGTPVSCSDIGFININD